MSLSLGGISAHSVINSLYDKGTQIVAWGTRQATWARSTISDKYGVALRNIAYYQQQAEPTLISARQFVVQNRTPISVLVVTFFVGYVLYNCCAGESDE